MKSPLIIGVSALALLTLSATLFAQTTTGSSLISQMKAATHAFTLSGDLNSGATDLESSPLVGKKTGDMLSAGEYNRLLELVGQGGGGKFEINDSTTKTSYYLGWDGASWRNSPGAVTATPCASGARCYALTTAAHDFCQVTNVAGTAPHVYFTYVGAKKYKLKADQFNSYTTHINVTCYDNIGTAGGGSGGGAGWVDVPVTDTADFDTTCQYRFHRPDTGALGWYYAIIITPKYAVVTFHDTLYHYWWSANKTSMRRESGQPTGGGDALSPTTKIQKLCGGGGGGNSGGGINLTEQTYTNILLPNESGAGPHFVSCTKADAAYYCGMKGSIIVSMTCKDVGTNIVLGINHNSGAWTTDDHYVAGGANRAIDVLKCASGIGTITDAKE